MTAVADLRVTDQMMRTARTVIAERLALHYINEQITEDDTALRLVALSPLPDTDAWNAFERLAGEIQWRQQVHDRDYDTGMCEPHEDHEALWDDACRRVDEAINHLIGGDRG